MPEQHSEKRGQSIAYKLNVTEHADELLDNLVYHLANRLKNKQAAYLPVKGLEQLITTICRVKKHLNPSIRFEGILISMLNARTNYAKVIMELINEYYGDSVFRKKL